MGNKSDNVGKVLSVVSDTEQITLFECWLSFLYVQMSNQVALLIWFLVN